MLPWEAIINRGKELTMGGIELYRGAKMAKEAKKMRKEYDAYERSIPEQDPGMVNLLGETRRRRRAFDAGTDPMTSYTQQQITNQGAQTQENAVRSGRGNLGDLMRVQAGTNAALAQSGAYASRNSAALFEMEGNLVGAMADSLYNRQLFKANLLWYEYARKREDANRSTSAGIGLINQPTNVMGGGGAGQGLKSYTNQGNAAHPQQSSTTSGAADNPNLNSLLSGMKYNSQSNYGFNYQQPTYAQQGIGFGY